MSEPLACPHCGATRLFGPAVIVDQHGVEHRYYDCACCHMMLLVDPDGTLTAKAGAW